MVGLMIAGSAVAQEGGNGSVLRHDDAPATTTESDANSVRVSAAVMAGLNTFKADPPYPEQARQARVSGTVVLSVVVNREGKVTRVAAISGPVLLRDAARESVQKWTYNPYLLNGKAVSVQTTVMVDFYQGK